jgi:leader peptidase (prepilin peptidase)/N-methyltransferase
MSDILKTAAHPAVFPWLGLAFGLVVGSFLNVVIHRLPKMMERDWLEQCAELARTGGSPVPPSQPRPESYNLFVPRSR